jgi:hypothetical protein
VYFWILHQNKINVQFYLKYSFRQFRHKFLHRQLREVWRICKSKKDRQYNQRTNNDLQNTTQKTKDWTTRTHKNRRTQIFQKSKHFLLHCCLWDTYKELTKSKLRQALLPKIIWALVVIII